MFHRMRSFVAISIVLVILLIPMSVVMGQEAGDIEEANRQLVLNLLEITFEDAEAELEADHSEDIWHEDFVGHNIAILGEPMSFDQMQETNASLYNAFTDLAVDVDVLLGDEEYVFAHYTITGTFTEDFVPATVVGGAAIPAHGGSVAITTLALFRIHEGKIIESWAEIDNFQIINQLMAPTEAMADEEDMDEGVVRVASHDHGALESANEALIRHLLEYTEGDIEAELASDYSSDIWHEDYVGHNIAGFDSPLSLEATQAGVAGFLAAFDGLHGDIQTVIADGEYVFARYTLTGTFAEDYHLNPEADPIPAHGEEISLVAHALFHIHEGKIIESWIEIDDAHLIGQLMTAPE